MLKTRDYNVIRLSFLAPTECSGDVDAEPQKPADFTREKYMHRAKNKTRSKPMTAVKK